MPCSLSLLRPSPLTSPPAICTLFLFLLRSFFVTFFSFVLLILVLSLLSLFALLVLPIIFFYHSFFVLFPRSLAGFWVEPVPCLSSLVEVMLPAVHDLNLWWWRRREEHFAFLPDTSYDFLISLSSFP